jgi:hypothetical protein
MRAHMIPYQERPNIWQIEEESEVKAQSEPSASQEIARCSLLFRMALS